MTADDPIPEGNPGLTRVGGAILAIVLLVSSCGHDHQSLLPLPTPQVVFHGTINDSVYELEGNWPTYPNTCELHGDTIKTFMCSRDYSPSSIPTGCYLRLDIYPFVRDSLDTAAITVLTTKWSLLKCAFFGDYFSESYEVVPADSAFSNRSVQAVIGALERSRGGRLLLTEMSAQSPPVSGSNAHGLLSIRKATIEGTIR